MTLELYFWTIVVIMCGLSAGLFGFGFALGARRANRAAGIRVGVIILLVTVVLCGGAKAIEAGIGPLVVYEAAWLASTLNFSLTGGYIAGKGRNGSGTRWGVAPILCIAIAIGSGFLMAARLHQLVDIVQQLGMGRAKAKPAGPDTSLNCKESLKRVYAGFSHYAEVNDALPPAAKWVEEEDLRGAVQADEWFHCPAVSDRKDDRYGYAYNDTLVGRRLNGKKLAEMPGAATTPLVYDSSNLAKSAHDAATSLPRPGRHAGRNNILYCDGHIEAAVLQQR